MSQYGTLRRGPMGADVIGHHFSQTHHGVFRDGRLHAKSMGVFGHLMTHTDGYGITPKTVAAAMRDGVAAIKGALQELEECGYLYRMQERRADGRLGATQYFFTDVPDLVNIREWAHKHWSGPGAENRPLVLTRENTPPETPTLPESDKPDTRRSEPMTDFPPAEKPPAENHTPKNIKATEDQHTQEREEEAARTRADEIPPAEEDTPPSLFALSAIRSLVYDSPQVRGEGRDVPEVIGEPEVYELARMFDAESARLAEAGVSAPGGDLSGWVGRGLDTAHSLFGILRYRLQPGRATAKLTRPKLRKTAPASPPPPAPPADPLPECAEHGQPASTCSGCAEVERAERQQRSKRGAAKARAQFARNREQQEAERAAP